MADRDSSDIDREEEPMGRSSEEDVLDTSDEDEDEQWEDTEDIDEDERGGDLGS